MGRIAEKSFADHRSWFARLQIVLSAVLLTVSCATPASPVSTTSSAKTATPSPKPENSGLTYPRTATTFLGQDELPTIDDLARYDVVVIDHEWANRKPRSFFDELHAKNPRLKLLAHVNVTDSRDQTGTYRNWPNTHKLWQISPSTSISEFPPQWLAHTALGAPVHEWPDLVMTNLTDKSPRVNGQLYVEYAVDWIVNTVWSAGIWDGIFLDVWGDRIWTADSDHWDIDRDGVDESADQIYGPGNPWDHGLIIGEQRLRAALPNAILVANGDRTLHGGLLDGRVFESFMDERLGREHLSDLEAYLASASGDGGRLPRLTMTINKDGGRGSPAAVRRARFELVATLLQGGFWAPMGKDYGSLEYYDELDGAGLGRGYLGQPLEANPTLAMLSERKESGTGSPADGVYRRDFDRGIVLINTSAKPVTIPLERTYTKLKGTQDPLTNDGAQVDSVTITPQDAIVLLR
jgi:putative glycosyl hydrolase-like family 15 (GHL15) protein